MARFRMQVAVAADSVLPRDRMVNTYHFDTPGGLPNAPGALCDDMAEIYNTKVLSSQGTHEIDVRLYDENTEGPPLAKKVINTGLAPVSPLPREVALCMSFRGALNTPSTRGRVYIPLCIFVGSAASAVGRPPLGFRDKIIQLGQAVSGLGGFDVDWGVYSPKNNTFVRVEMVWCDDEWDTVRSRGLRATTRTSAAVSG